jgi:hypothetical protein
MQILQLLPWCSGFIFSSIVCYSITMCVCKECVHKENDIKYYILLKKKQQSCAYSTFDSNIDKEPPPQYTIIAKEINAKEITLE